MDGAEIKNIGKYEYYKKQITNKGKYKKRKIYKLHIKSCDQN